MPTATTWTPLLTGELASRAEAAAIEIAAAIEQHAEPGGGLSLVEGAAGHALLHAYVACHTGSEASEELALAWLDRAVERIDAAGGDASLYAGVTGVGWVAQHVARLLDVDEIDPDGELDRTLAGLLEVTPWRADFDLVSGLVGFGVYALERLPREEAVRCLELIVARLGELAERTPDGTTWHTDPRLLPEHQRKEAPEGYYNLGLAHGVPGVIALLGGVVAAGVARDTAGALLEQSVSWLLANGLPEGSDSAFAVWIAPGPEPTPARTAWCYGDPGVAAALHVASKAAAVDAWERAALDVARGAAARRGAATRVEDAWLCHGAAGLAQIFNRVYQATGDEQLGEAARHWLERTLAMREPGRGIAGYSQPPGMEEHQGDGTGFLTGAGGVALTLLAATGEVEPGWDRVLAISARERQRDT